MKRAISLAVALVMIFAFACPAFAAGSDFVGSITYKDGPILVSAELGGDGVGECIVITSIGEAKAKTTDITQEERDLLLEVYAKLNDGSMDPGLDDGYVIRELVDINFAYNSCRQDDDHGDKDEELAKPGVTITLVIKLGIAAGEDIVVKAYKDGQWVDIETTNNGDGTVTCVFEHFCPVLFAVDNGSSSQPPKTGDTMGQYMPLWIGLMVLSVAGIVTVSVVSSRKKA